MFNNFFMSQIYNKKTSNAIKKHKQFDVSAILKLIPKYREKTDKIGVELFSKTLEKFSEKSAKQTERCY